MHILSLTTLVVPVARGSGLAHGDGGGLQQPVVACLAACTLAAPNTARGALAGRDCALLSLPRLQEGPKSPFADFSSLQLAPPT